MYNNATRNSSNNSRHRSQPHDRILRFERFTASLCWHNRDYFTLRIRTHDGDRISDGDRWDFENALSRSGGGSPVERLRRAFRRLLADPNRTRRVRAA